MKANEILSKLTAELKQQVLDKLTVYDSAIIDFENGKYKIGSLSVRDKYPADFRHVGIIKNSDVYTKEEMIENYKNL